MRDKDGLKCSDLDGVRASRLWGMLAIRTICPLTYRLPPHPHEICQISSFTAQCLMPESGCVFPMRKLSGYHLQTRRPIPPCSMHETVIVSQPRTGPHTTNYALGSLVKFQVHLPPSVFASRLGFAKRSSIQGWIFILPPLKLSSMLYVANRRRPYLPLKASSEKEVPRSVPLIPQIADL